MEPFDGSIIQSWGLIVCRQNRNKCAFCVRAAPIFVLMPDYSLDADLIAGPNRI